MEMKINPFILLVAVVVVAISLLVGGFFLGQRGLYVFNKNIIGQSNPNILFFTNPVMDFTGKVDKISGNSVWISGKYTITPPPTPPNAPTVIPGSVITALPLPPSKMFTYKVNIAPYTIINKPEAPVTYLFRIITPTPSPKLTIKDVRVGQMVSVSSTSDLRSLKTEEFDAYSVKLPPIINTIAGKIAEIKVNDGIIILKAILPIRPGENQPTPEVPKETEYAISVNSDTEISRMSQTVTPKAGATPAKPQPIKYQMTDLKTDILVTVYTNSDVIENQKLKALLIEPPVDFISSSSSALTPSPRPSVTPKNS